MKSNHDKTALVIFSGGLDSTVALYWAKANYKSVAALNFAYGSNHQERECAASVRIAEKLGIERIHIDMDFIGKHFSSALLGGQIPEGDYDPKNMSSTVVPFRNGIMLAIAAGIAESRGIDEIILGNHGGDHFIYPDCRPIFITFMQGAILSGTDKKVSIRSPFCVETKSEIVSIGSKLGVDFALTYSCYKGGERHCGVCATCRERKQAFSLAGIPDPTIYES